MHSHSFARTHMPYLLQRTGDGQWIALNRNYAPLGTIGGDPHADYDDHPSRMHLDAETIGYLRGITAHLASLGAPRDRNRVYFYTGQCPPTESPKYWTAYAKVMRALASVTREDDPQRDGVMARTLEASGERQERVERERAQGHHHHQVEGEGANAA